MSTLELDGHRLATYQRGSRRYAIEHHYRYKRWHPTVLLSACLRRAIFQLSSGEPLEAVTTAAVNEFVSRAKYPGLDVKPGTHVYTLAMDLCATMRTILSYLTRITLTTLHELQPVQLRQPNSDDTVLWSFSTHVDDSGLLHRWVFVDSITPDTPIIESHKWEFIGDQVVHRSPLMLHLVAIGRTDASRRSSPWCRAYKNPLIHGDYRFKKRTKGQFTENWTPIYFADNRKNDPEHWVDQMIKDGVHESLVLHQTFHEPSPAQIDRIQRDILLESKDIQQLDIQDPMKLPMCRTSCDIPYVCPHQTACYSESTTIENSGLYERR